MWSEILQTCWISITVFKKHTGSGCTPRHSNSWLYLFRSSFLDSYTEFISYSGRSINFQHRLERNGNCHQGLVGFLMWAIYFSMAREKRLYAPFQPQNTIPQADLDIGARNSSIW